MKKKAGRPEKYIDDFYKLIVNEHEQYSLSQIAKNHNVSTSTAIKWLARGRELISNGRE